MLTANCFIAHSSNNAPSSNQPRPTYAISVAGPAGPVKLPYSQTADTSSIKAVSSVIKLRVTPADQTVASGFPVELSVELINISNHAISLWHENAKDLGGLIYRVKIHDEDLNIPPETKLGRRIRLNTTDIAKVTPEEFMAHRSGAFVALGPSETSTSTINVSRLYDLTRIGRYTVQLERLDDESKSFVDSNEATVTVIANDGVAPPNRPTFSLKLSSWPTGDVVKAGSKIVLTTSKINDSDKEIDNSWSTIPAYDYGLDVRDEKGNPVPQTDELRRLLQPDTARRYAKKIHETLEPHRLIGTFGESIPISDYFNLGQPGRYTIQASQPDPNGGPDIMSNIVTITVSE